MGFFKKCKFTIEYEVDLDAIKGWGYEPEDWHALAMEPITRQSHYNTKAKVVASEILDRDIVEPA
jgi:hypothetical protein